MTAAEKERGAHNEPLIFRHNRSGKLPQGRVLRSGSLLHLVLIGELGTERHPADTCHILRRKPDQSALLQILGCFYIHTLAM